MRKTVSVLFTCLCAAFLALAGPVSEAAAAPSLLEPVRIWGPVTKEADSEASQNAHTLTMDNQSGQSYDGEIRLNITDIYTRILDAQTGMPVAFLYSITPCTACMRASNRRASSASMASICARDCCN